MTFTFKTRTHMSRKTLYDELRTFIHLRGYAKPHPKLTSQSESKV